MKSNYKLRWCIHSEHGGTLVTKLIFIIIILTLCSCDLQKNMLYYPNSNLPTKNELVAHQIQFWRYGSSDYRGFISTVAISDVKGTIVVFHGNAGTAADRSYYVNALASFGYRIILAEYPGYGARKGKLGEIPFVNDAKETLRLAYEKYGKPIYLLGESLGCGVAAAVAKDTSVQIKGIILITPWDTLLSVAKEKIPWLPVRLFLSDKYDSIQNLKTFQGRIAIIGAERDKVIPIHHAQTLYASLLVNKKMWTIKGAGHNDWLEMVDHSWWKEITDFIRSE
jgi:pimeloyl-ACP methyl ester carboxylesterase